MSMACSYSRSYHILVNRGGFQATGLLQRPSEDAMSVYPDRASTQTGRLIRRPYKPPATRVTGVADAEMVSGGSIRGVMRPAQV